MLISNVLRHVGDVGSSLKKMAKFDPTTPSMSQYVTTGYSESSRWQPFEVDHPIQHYNLQRITHTIYMSFIETDQQYI